MRLGQEGIYVATSQLYDEEMRERAAKHRERRDLAAGGGRSAGFQWKTVEEPYELSALLKTCQRDIVLVDCLTLWLTNWLLKYESETEPEAKVFAKVEELTAVLAGCSARVIVVTNEVGSGIVPAYALGRQFRDLAGWMNQRIAAVCSEVFLVTAGIPVELKQLAYRFPDEEKQQ